MNGYKWIFPSVHLKNWALASNLSWFSGCFDRFVVWDLQASDGVMILWGKNRMMQMIMFAATNFAVMAVLSVTARLLGLDQAMGGMVNLLVMSAGIGFTGALISLFMSKSMAKRSMRVQVIERPSNQTERWIQETVYRQAAELGISNPEVGIFPSAEPNAFATGWNKNNALIAVSTGLLEHMNEGEVEAVLGHEVAHAANGDMLTMGLIQGVLNTFVVFFSRVIGAAIDSALRGRNDRGGYGIGYHIASFFAEMVLGVLAQIIAAWFSRRREYRADAGGAQVASTEKMISALRALQRVSQPRGLPGDVAAFGILGNHGRLLQQLFSTHPALELRIAALEASVGP